MDTIEEQVGIFSSKCDDLMQAKFILAPSKISELLRTIAAAPALVSLFEKAARPFNYLKAQEECMLPSPDGTQNKGILVLPENPMERLAFIFCLLVDIDNQTINFNLFLQTFFAEDGSYTQAFETFLTQVIRPFKTIVCGELAAKPAAAVSLFHSEGAEKSLKRNRKTVFEDFLPVIKAEVAELDASDLPETDRYAGVTILNELYTAAKTVDEMALKALLLGYNYFIAHTGRTGKNALKMCELLEEL